MEASPTSHQARPEALRDAALLVSSQLGGGLVAYPLIAFGLAFYTRLDARTGVAMMPFAIALAVVCGLRWLAILRFRRLERWSAWHWHVLMVAGAVVTALIWSGLAAKCLMALGLVGPSLLLMVIVVGAAYGALVVWAPFPRVAQALLACFLAPPLLTALTLPDSESRVLAIILAALTLFSLGVGRSLHRDYWLGVARVSALEGAVAEAERANSAKTDFLANVSHEIRTPMVGIVGPAEILARSGLTPEQRRHVELILSSSRVLGNLIDTLLDVAKIEAQGARIEVARFDVRRALELIGERHRGRAEEKGLALIVDLEELGENAWIVADEMRLGQVIDNLVSNAVKFTTAGEVRITAALEPGAVGEGAGAVFSCRVEDSGPGIPESSRHEVFRPFVQLDSSVRRQQGGTGLGLTIARSLVELMGGTLVLDERPGGGARFLVTLPVETAQPGAGEESAEALPGRDAGAEAPARSHRILVAEDDPVSQVVVRSLLTHLGHKVEVVADGEQAIEVFQEHRFDLVFLDCQMPRLDGFATARELRLRLRGRPLPILALTAHAFEGDRDRAIDAGMDGHLRKPVSLQTLQETLDHWLPPGGGAP